MSYYGYDYGNNYSAAMSPVMIGIEIAMIVFSLVCMWRIFTKAGKPGWACLIPFYNLYVLFEITWGKGIKFLLLLIPFANLVIAIITIVKLAKVFGKGGGFACGLLFLSIIFMPILAFGSAQYVGVPGVSRDAGYAYGQPNPYGAQGYQQNPQGYQNPYSQGQQNPYAQPQQGYQNPYAQRQQPQQGYQNPYAQPQQPQQNYQNPYAQPQQPQPDPYAQTRQDPYAQPRQDQWQQTAAQPAKAQRFCPYCGSPMAEGAAFCTSCGAKAQ